MIHTIRQVHSTAGYTIDQMIMVIAVISILVTLVIVSVGWNLINRTSGAKLGSQLKQIEAANGQFYGTFHIWPHQAYTTPAVSAGANVAALAGSSAITAWNSVVTTPRNFIPGFRNASGTTVTHNYSTSGNTITMDTAANPFGLTGNYLVVQFSQVPFAEVIEAEIAVDGGTEATLDAGNAYTTGRVVARTGAANNCVTGTTGNAPVTTGGGATSRAALVNVCYASNVI